MTRMDSKNLIQNLPTSPGIYRLLDADNKVLYVGKARNLRKRVQSYFRKQASNARIHSMMQSVAAVDVTVTHTETEALLLEDNLIKSLRPRYNILMRDDKSYPYIFVSDAQEFPRLAFHRGARREKGRYFGPYPSATAVRESLKLLQKIFPVRQCEDSFFRNRSRPCLQYQIKRCSAPCVGLIDREHYQQDVRHALMFLAGRSQAIVREMVNRMERASAKQEYEAAAQYRDRIASLKRVQEKQYISSVGGDADAVAAATQGETACVAVTFIRGGLNLGSKSFFSKTGINTKPKEILAAFLPQYYLGKAATDHKAIPARIYLNQSIEGKKLLEDIFSRQVGNKVSIRSARHGAPLHWLKMTELNAKEALHRLLAGKTNLRQRFEALREALSLDGLPERVECFDISHTMGEATVAACVVFDLNGPVKSDYRRFNIENIQAGDDYAALTQALERRYQKAKAGEGRLPDLLIIDGGKGQLAAAKAVLDELQIEGVRLLGVAKGRVRRPGREQLFLSGSNRPTILPAASPALHLIQQIRDEAHRFAITGHRQRRARARTTSTLEKIPGIGDRRRQALLKNLGGLREVARAGIEDLARVPGISPTLARRVYDVFHERDT